MKQKNTSKEVKHFATQMSIKVKNTTKILIAFMLAVALLFGESTDSTLA